RLTRAVVITINDRELAILCNLMDGWGTNWGGNLDGDKRQVLDQLIAKGFVEPADQQSIATYKHTLKTSGRALRWNKRHTASLKGIDFLSLRMTDELSAGCAAADHPTIMICRWRRDRARPAVSPRRHRPARCRRRPRIREAIQRSLKCLGRDVLVDSFP